MNGRHEQDRAQALAFGDFGLGLTAARAVQACSPQGTGAAGVDEGRLAGAAGGWGG
jgi:hypothetical protein